MWLRVIFAPTVRGDMIGARTTGLAVGQEFRIHDMQHPNGFEPLTARYHEGYREGWPDAYRFQAIRRFWRVDAPYSSTEHCILTVTNDPDAHSIENIRQELADAEEAATYAHRFNLHLSRSMGELKPRVTIALPVICEVFRSCWPTLVPKGTVVTLYPYMFADVQKFVFSGAEEVMEVPHAFFHFSAFSSGGKRIVCDLQGAHDGDGSFTLVDATVLRLGKPTVASVVAQTWRKPMQEAKCWVRHNMKDKIEPLEWSTNHGDWNVQNAPELKPFEDSVSTAAELHFKRFDTLHPQCCQACHAFDPQRHAVKATKTLCGGAVACGPKCGL